MKYVIGVLFILWILIFYSQMGITTDETQLSSKSQVQSANFWSKPYEDFHLDLSLPFDRKKLILSGPSSLPVFRILASEENKIDLDFGMDPLNQIMTRSASEPPCQIPFPSKKE